MGAQTLQGRVLDEGDERPVATAVVRLVGEGGESRAISVADSAGFFRLAAPAPGVYRLTAERLGYDPVESPPLEVLDEGGTYGVDLLLRPAPIPIPGLEISAGPSDRELRLAIGVSPRSLRIAPIGRDEILADAERGRDLTSLIRFRNLPGMVVRQDDEGPCFQARARGCLPVYLNYFRLERDFVTHIPIDMASSIVILYPGESIAYPAGAILAFTGHRSR